MWDRIGDGDDPGLDLLDRFAAMGEVRPRGYRPCSAVRLFRCGPPVPFPADRRRHLSLATTIAAPSLGPALSSSVRVSS